MSRPFIIALTLQVTVVCAEVHVYVEQGSGSALIRYDCTAGEVVKAWALNVSVDQGSILGVSDYFRGPSTVSQQGYGIFPASFRDHIVTGGPSIDWNVPEYSPVALVEDAPAGTLPGLGSSGVTLELAALWDTSTPAAAPPSSGTLCSLQLSETATVTVSENIARGGILPANPSQVLAPVFTSALVEPPEITGYFDVSGIFVITYSGGTLERADSIEGPWSDADSTNRLHAEFTSGPGRQYFRVRSP